MRIMSAVCENSKTPVKRLASYPHETKVVRKNYVRVKHAHVEKSVVQINRFTTGQKGTSEAIVWPKVGQNHTVIVSKKTAGNTTPYHVARNINLSPHGNRVA